MARRIPSGVPWRLARAFPPVARVLETGGRIDFESLDDAGPNVRYTGNGLDVRAQVEALRKRHIGDNIDSDFPVGDRHFNDFSIG